MGFFQDLGLALKDSVGNMMKNDEDDVINVKNALHSLGYRAEPAQNGIIERETDEGIRSFQREKGLKVDGYLMPGGETEKAIRDVTRARIAENKPKWFGALEMNDSKARKKSIINDTPAWFGIKENEEADDKEPWHEFSSFSEVGKHEKLMEQKARKYQVDPDLVKAIAYMETTHGQYDRLKASFDVNQSIRPMNVHSEYWKDLGYSREDLKIPEKNIEAGVRLLKAISERVPNSGVRGIATIYQNLAAEKVSDYGARVNKIYRQKPWQKK